MKNLIIILFLFGSIKLISQKPKFYNKKSIVYYVKDSINLVNEFEISEDIWNKINYLVKHYKNRNYRLIITNNQNHYYVVFDKKKKYRMFLVF
jgi:hypothetical protein